MTTTTDAPEHLAEPIPSPVTGRRRPPAARWVSVVAIAAFTLLAGGIVAALVLGRDDTAGTEGYRYQVVVPAGTSSRIAAGAHVELMPATVPLQVGDHLVVRNLDDQVAVVGPFSVRPGETLDHRFTQPGTFEGVCAVGGETAHSVKIVVT